MIDEKYKLTLAKFVNAAKFVIYDDKRADALLKMMTGKGTGAMMAVHTVIAALEQHKPVPKDVVPLLSVSVLMLLLELMKSVFGKQLPPDTLKKMVYLVMSSASEDHVRHSSKPTPPKQPPTAQQPTGGIIQGAIA